MPFGNIDQRHVPDRIRIDGPVPDFKHHPVRHAPKPCMAFDYVFTGSQVNKFDEFPGAVFKRHFQQSVAKTITLLTYHSLLLSNKREERRRPSPITDAISAQFLESVIKRLVKRNVLLET